MRILRNKFLVKLITAICLVFLLFSFTQSNKVFAAEGDDKVWGGVLINPIVDLMTACGDFIMEILHTSIQSQDAALIKIDGHSDTWDIFASIAGIVLGIVAAVGFIVAVVGTGALIGGALALLKTGAFVAKFTLTLTTVAGAIGTGVVAGVAVKEAMIPYDIYLPAYSITAEEIFKNEILLFDVNFFKPMESKQVQSGAVAQAKGYYETLLIQYGPGGNRSDTKWEDGTDDMETIIGPEKNAIGEDETTGKYYDLRQELATTYGEKAGHFSIKTIVEGLNGDTITAQLNEILERVDNKLQEKGIPKMDREHIGSNVKRSSPSDDETQLDSVLINITVPNVDDPDSSEDWTCVRILFMKGLDVDTSAVTTTETIKSTAEQLQGIVSTWYFILRNMALLVLMLVLIYIGIRIVIGSTAGEKAKYKERLMDWLVALCLIFVMHYVMVFAIEIVDKIIDLIGTGSNGNKAYIQLTDKQEESAKDILKDWDTIGGGKGAIDYEGEASGENGALVWPTDLAGLYRIQSQLTEEGTTKWAGYSLCYVVLVLFTLFFAFTYAKRVLYMAFLTIIAPLVAMTYPIDKITDGKAQAFDAWLKEYIFNLMIQPLHLLLYTILVSSAYSLASESPLYALVALGFMTPAEKLMRRFFGFEKAKTPGLLGGAAGTALAMSGLQKILGGNKHHGGKNGGSSGKEKDGNNLKFARKNNVDAMETIADGEPEGTILSGAVPKTANILNHDSDDSNNKVPPAVNSNPANLKNTMPKPNAKKVKLSNQKELEEIGKKRAEEVARRNKEAEQTFSATKAVRAAYNKPVDNSQPRTFKEIKDANKAARKREIKGAVTKFGHRIAGGGAEMARQLGIQALEGAQGLGKKAVKMAGGLTAATGAALLSMPGGELNKLAQNTAIGYSAGASFANSLLDENSRIDMEAVEREADMAAEGENYKNAVIEKENENIRLNPANINYLRQTMGISREEARDIMDTTGEKCISNGIKEVEDIATIHKLTTGDNAISFNMAVAAREYAQKRLPSDTDKMTAKSINQHKERWKNEYILKGYGERSQELAERSFDLAIRYNKAKSSLTKMP